MEQLIPVINRLYEVFEAIDPDDPDSAFASSIDLPRIVVVGAQSSGKSSVLESIVMRDFLPRGKDIVTRRPLILQLVHRPCIYMDALDDFGKAKSRSNDLLLSISGLKLKASTSQSTEEEEWGEFGHLPGQKFYDFHQIRREIEKETQRIAGSNKGISKQPIYLKVFSPHVVNLTLVDLPGITKIPVGDQPDDIENQIRELVYDFVEKPNSIILAVTPANIDIVNSDSLKIAREVDPSGSRTIGVLTKLDLMDSGTDAMDILSNQGSFKLNLGFIGVVNRSQHDINMNRPVGEALKSEIEFFKSHQKYKNLVPRCGSSFLAKELNKILLEHIRDQLPGLKARINQLIISTQTELQSYGDLGIPGKSNRGTILLKLVTSYVTDFQDALHGTLKSASTSSEPVGGAKINEIFNDIYARLLNETESLGGLSTSDVRNAIRNASGPKPALFVSEASFEVLTKQQISKLEGPAQRCVDLVYEELQRLSIKVDRKELLRFPVLVQKLVTVTNDFLKDRLTPTVEMVESLVKIEQSYINTNHPDFWKSGSALTTLARILEDRRRRELSSSLTGHSKSSEEIEIVHQPTSPAIPMKTIGKDERGIFSYLFKAPEMNTKPSEVKRSSASRRPHQPQSFLLNEVEHLHDINEKEEIETKLILSLIHSYLRIVRKNIQDSVPKAIMHFLVNHVTEHLPTRLVTELYKDEKIEELLKEDEDVVRQRERCKAALEAYRQAAQLLSQVRDTDLYKQ